MMELNLWGEEFERTKENKTKKILKKINDPKDALASEEEVLKYLKSKADVKDKVSLIKERVLLILGKQKENTICIYTKEDLKNYINKGIEFGRISIDTETNNSVDIVACKLMGLCLYVKGEKQTYVPINHVDIDTGERLSDQLTEEEVAECLKPLIDSDTKIIFHNGKFDYEVLKTTLNIEMPIYWDTYTAARLLDENAPSAGLKQLYIENIDPSQEKYSIEHLFANVDYAIIEPEIFALYAATDPMMTDRLYEWQIIKFEDPSLKGVLRTLINIEIPIITVVAKMELRGISFDDEYAERLSKKYHDLMDDCDRRISEELSKHENVLNAYLDGHPESKIKTPLNIESPTQLAEFLFDVLKAPKVNIKNPRGTGYDELVRLYEKTHWPICNLILEKREYIKILNTYVDKLRGTVNEGDGRIHCTFNPTGTDTGRFASKDPNLQNIPAEKKEVRMLLCARDGYSLVSSDYSAQEVRLTAWISQDKEMIKAYDEDRDLYSVIASIMYNNKYEDNLEFYPEGTKILYEGEEVVCGNKTHTNKEGKERRQSAKSVLIGSLYGRGASSIAQQLNQVRDPSTPEITTRQAQDIMNRFYKGFPTVKNWMDESVKFTRKTGYMNDWYGRRRHLPDIQLPRFEVIDITEEKEGFNPLLECDNRTIKSDRVLKYEKDLAKASSKTAVNKIINEANAEGIEVKDNTGFISKAERQCVNFQPQGGGADLIKLAMIEIDKNERLKQLDFHLLLTIHDEIIGECPEENAEEVQSILPKIMIKVAEENGITVKIKCDATTTKHWYEDEIITGINKEYATFINNNYTKEEACSLVCNEHPELLRRSVEDVLLNGANFL